MTASWFAAKRFSDYVDSEYHKAVSPLGLKVSEARILLALYERPNITLTDLANAVGLSAGQVHHIVNRMERRGYIESSYGRIGGITIRCIQAGKAGVDIREQLQRTVAAAERTIQSHVFDYFPIGAAAC